MDEKKFTLKKLSELTNSKLFGDETQVITGVNSLEDATPLEASFLANNRYSDAMKKSKAGVICVEEGLDYPKNKNFLISKTPSKTFQMILELFLFSNDDLGFKGILYTL
jgi:UDP-3-O-[3-hydroxymyristoyl] glucosamine N-acyltransferase